jgi:putative glutamine amidotransferase
MSRPLIAIPGRRSDEAKGHRTPVVSGGRFYADAISRAGGLPIFIPPSEDFAAVAETIARCDGMVLLGGGDVDPTSYGQTERTRLFGVNAMIDKFEIAAIKSAIELDLPILAICRGHQVLNVALGGTLVQHLENYEEHRDVMHAVSVVGGSRIASAMGTTEPLTHSWHHQAIDSLAPSLQVVATAPFDDTIEAVEHSSATWVVGVQWHPEDTASEDASQQGLFDAVVRQASTRISQRNQ